MTYFETYRYAFIIISFVSFGLIIDTLVHFIKQSKNSGQWKIKLEGLAIYLISIMLLMPFIFRLSSFDIPIALSIYLWVLLPTYSILRNLNKE